MRKFLVFCSVVGALAVTSTNAYAWGHDHGHGHGKGHDKQAVCHKPGTPAEHVLYLPAPAIPAHLGHGDYLGECRTQSPPPTQGPCSKRPHCRCVRSPCGTPPPKPPTCPTSTCSTPPAAPCPPTQTTTTIVNNVTVVDQGLPAPPAPASPSTPAAPCRQVRGLLFFSPTGTLGRTTFKVGRHVVARRNPHFHRSAIRIHRLSLRGSSKRARLTITSVVHKRGHVILFRWSGVVRRCGGWLVVDPDPPVASSSRSSWSKHA